MGVCRPFRNWIIGCTAHPRSASVQAVKTCCWNLILREIFLRDLRRDQMRRFVEGADRRANDAAPECLGDWLTRAVLSMANS